MSVRIIIGDVREKLAELEGESVHCCVTSPPYWGLRDYGTAKWDGGNPACDHKGMVLASSSSLAGYTSENVKVRTHTMPQGQVCSKCGAQRVDSQIGLEADFREYVETMVSVFREVRRALRSDGTLWLNLGDSYHNGDKGGYEKNRVKATDSLQRSNLAANFIGAPNRQPQPGLKPKDLCGIPWRVALALQVDGWWLRQDIIWSKPNPMPESVTDRCTKAHEYLFLLSKRERYWFDAKSIADIAVSVGSRRDNGEGDKFVDRGMYSGRAGNNDDGTRNKRSVWEVATQPISEAHFATFPPALIEPCVLAGCPRGGTVLDPFFGAGTTGLVADRLGRNCIGIELNPEYAEMARRRIEQDAGMFAEVA